LHINKKRNEEKMEKNFRKGKKILEKVINPFGWIRTTADLVVFMVVGVISIITLCLVGSMMEDHQQPVVVAEDVETQQTQVPTKTIEPTAINPTPTLIPTPTIEPTPIEEVSSINPGPDDGFVSLGSLVIFLVLGGGCIGGLVVLIVVGGKNQKK
jgi:hypothetical protein